MLADPRYCEMVHKIGLASLHADDKQIWHLTKIYWCVSIPHALTMCLDLVWFAKKFIQSPAS